MNKILIEFCRGSFHFLDDAEAPRRRHIREPKEEYGWYSLLWSALIIPKQKAASFGVRGSALCGRRHVRRPSYLAFLPLSALVCCSSQTFAHTMLPVNAEIRCATWACFTEALKFNAFHSLGPMLGNVVL
jgi:hypothetical protein